MRVLGIDCGGEYTGYGVVEQDEQGLLHPSVQRRDPAASARGTGNPADEDLPGI